MHKHTFTISSLAAADGSHFPSTMLIIAVLDVAEPEKGVKMVTCSSGQALADLFNEIDQSGGDQVIAGVQFAIPPQLNGSKQWIVEPVLSFAKAKLRIRGDAALDTYAYRLDSDAVFIDNDSVDPTLILEWQSLYEVLNEDGSKDPQTTGYLAWLSIVLTRMINALNLQGEAEDAV